MCKYYIIQRRCGHEYLLAGPNCYLIYEQLQRINDLAEWARQDLPFEIPEECLPNRRNIERRNVNSFCNWECRNNSPYGGGRCGTRDARYGQGSERIGVGWRYWGSGLWLSTLAFGPLLHAQLRYPSNEILKPFASVCGEIAAIVESISIFDGVNMIHIVLLE